MLGGQINKWGHGESFSEEYSNESEQTFSFKDNLYMSWALKLMKMLVSLLSPAVHHIWCRAFDGCVLCIVCCSDGRFVIEWWQLAFNLLKYKIQDTGGTF